MVARQNEGEIRVTDLAADINQHTGSEIAVAHYTADGAFTQKSTLAQLSIVLETSFITPIVL